MNLIDMRISNSNWVLLSCRYTVSRRTHVRSGLFHRTQFGGNAVQDGAEHKNGSHVHPSAKVRKDFLSRSLKESPPLPSSQVLRCYQKFLWDPEASGDEEQPLTRLQWLKQFFLYMARLITRMLTFVGLTSLNFSTWLWSFPAGTWCILEKLRRWCHISRPLVIHAPR